MSGVGYVAHRQKMLHIRDLEALGYSRIFISNPEYRILFRNNLLAAKRADRAEV